MTRQTHKNYIKGVHLTEASIMLPILHRKQCVLVNYPIRFRYDTYIADFHEIVLKKREFLNLHNEINSFRSLKPLNYYPLGGGILL